MHKNNDIDERREFLRLEYEHSLNFKVLSGEKLLTKSGVFSRNISASGLLFRTASETSIPPLSSIVWIELDPKMLNICGEIETDLIIHKNGVFGRVVRIAEGEPGKSYDIGVCFLRRKNMTKTEIQLLING